MIGGGYRVLNVTWVQSGGKELSKSCPLYTFVIIIILKAHHTLHVSVCVYLV